MHKAGGWAAAAATTTPSFAKTPLMRLRSSARVRFVVRMMRRCALTNKHSEFEVHILTRGMLHRSRARA